jgi:hypothetical protein
MPGSQTEAAGLLDAYLEAEWEGALDVVRGAGGVLTGAPVTHSG